MPESWIAPDSHYDKVKEGDLTEPARVTGHEGRHRMAAIMKEYGDVPIETHLLFPGLRRRHITDNMVERLNGNILNEQGKLFNGPWFSMTETVTEAVDADFVDRNFLIDIRNYNILIALSGIISRFDRDTRHNRDTSIYTDTLVKNKTLIIRKLLECIKEADSQTSFKLVAYAVSQLVNVLHINWPELTIILKSCQANIDKLPDDHPMDDDLDENVADDDSDQVDRDFLEHTLDMLKYRINYGLKLMINYGIALKDIPAAEPILEKNKSVIVKDILKKN